MNIDLREELRKRDELLDGYLKQIEIQEEFIPVSYTHLDVYKRQAFWLCHAEKCTKWCKICSIDFCCF